MHKTTLYLDEETYVRLQRMAVERRQSQAFIVREALAEYVARLPGERAWSVGLGKSGRGDLSVKAEAMLEGFGDH